MVVGGWWWGAHFLAHRRAPSCLPFLAHALLAGCDRLWSAAEQSELFTSVSVVLLVDRRGLGLRRFSPRPREPCMACTCTLLSVCEPADTPVYVCVHCRWLVRGGCGGDVACRLHPFWGDCGGSDSSRPRNMYGLHATVVRVVRRPPSCCVCE